MSPVKVTGGPLLRARLRAVGDSAADIADEWGHIAADGIRQDAPVRTGRFRGSVEQKPSPRGEGVYGAFWGIFIDRGTKAHDITARKAKALAFESGGRTIFARKVHRRRMPKRPFITRNAQEALRDERIIGQVIEAWNRKRTRSGFRRMQP